MKQSVDRHSKKRAILIDSTLLFNENIQDYLHEIIDISELSDYYDTIILCEDTQEIEKYLYHWGLKAVAIKKYEDATEIKNKYRFLILFCAKSEAKQLRQFYRCETLTR